MPEASADKQASSPADCPLCARLSDSAHALCKSHRRARDRPGPQRELVRARLDAFDHTYLPPKVSSQLSDSKGAKLLDLSLGGFGVRLGDPRSDVRLVKADIGLLTPDGRETIATFEGGEGVDAVWSHRGLCGFQVRSFEATTQDLLPQWRDVLYHLLNGYTAPVIMPGKQLWKALEPLRQDLAAGDPDYNERLERHLRRGFQRDSILLQSIRRGQTVACFARARSLGDHIDRSLKPRDRMVLQVISRVILDDQLLFGHQVSRHLEVDRSACKSGIGFALMGQSLYWQEHRHLLDDIADFPDVALICGVVHNGRGMRKLHVDFAKKVEARGEAERVLYRRIRNYLCYPERICQLEQQKVLRIDGTDYPFIIERWSEPPEKDDARRRRSRAEAAIRASLTQRGDIFRRVVGMLPDRDLGEVDKEPLARPLEEVGLKRRISSDREIFIASVEVDGELTPALALTADTIALNSNLSGMLDVARPFVLGTQILPNPETQQELLGELAIDLTIEASRWYSATPRSKKLFALIDDDEEAVFEAKRLRERGPEEKVLVDTKGPGFMWAIERSLVGEWMLHIDEVTRERIVSCGASGDSES